MKFPRYFMMLILCVLVATASSCSKSADEDPTGEAVAVAKSWLGLVDRGEYGASWEQAADLFKTSVTIDGWEQSLDNARKPLGELVSRSVESAELTTSIPGAPEGEYVVIQFTSDFTNRKSAIETVTPMMDPDGKWRVSGYYIK